MMNQNTVPGGALAVLLALLALAAGGRALERGVDPAAAAAAAPHGGLIHGRVTTEDGATHEGRLRWGGHEEALWGNCFNGFKARNPWVVHVPPRQRPKERRSIGLFGLEIAGWTVQADLGRPFMARFGDIARIEPRGRDLRVTLKSGSVFELDRFAADDLADGVRVWDGEGGVVDLGEWQIRSIELLPAALPAGAPPAAALRPLHGTVRTRQGDFTGLVQWDREACVGADELQGHGADGEARLRFDGIRSIARRSDDGALVTLLDGREIALSGTRDVGRGHRGTYVDDPRYGRVLISWDAFERVDFAPGGTGPAYRDFPAGRPLTGSVVTRSGLRLAGRLVYDLDESESTETLDAPSRGVDYSIPFGLIASIARPGIDAGDAERARVTLHGGEELQLELAGDLGEWNAGTLVFVEGRQHAEYVPWTDVQRVDLDRPEETYPPSGPR